jgi:hypothetical protein
MAAADEREAPLAVEELVRALVGDQHHRVRACGPRLGDGADERGLLGLERHAHEAAGHRRRQRRLGRQADDGDLRPAALEDRERGQLHLGAERGIGRVDVGGDVDGARAAAVGHERRASEVELVVSKGDGRVPHRAHRVGRRLAAEVRRDGRTGEVVAAREQDCPRIGARRAVADTVAFSRLQLPERLGRAAAHCAILHGGKDPAVLVARVEQRDLHRSARRR